MKKLEQSNSQLISVRQIHLKLFAGTNNPHSLQSITCARHFHLKIPHEIIRVTLAFNVAKQVRATLHLLTHLIASHSQTQVHAHSFSLMLV